MTTETENKLVYYMEPGPGWLCFHCGERFTTIGGARNHFGFDPSSDPTCRIKVGEERGLEMKIRKLEAELLSYRVEDSAADRAMAAMRADHSAALKKAEEDGYNKGVRDALKDWEEANNDAHRS